MDRNGRWWLEAAFAVAMLGIFLVFLVAGAGYPPRPRELPLLVAGVGTGLCVAQVLANMRKRSRPPALNINWRRVGQCFGAMLLFLAGCWLLGMVLAAGLFVAALGWFLGARKPLSLIGVSAGTALAVYVIFVRCLHLVLPVGRLTGF